MSKEVKVSFAPSLTTLLTVVFVIAKLTGYITWSWWWVFSPIWIGLLIALVVIFILYLIVR
jgi:hypothetical protein